MVNYLLIIYQVKEKNVLNRKINNISKGKFEKIYPFKLNEK